MKYLVFIALFASLLYANHDSNATAPQDVNATVAVEEAEDGLVEVKDTSGATEEELRDKANKLDDVNSSKVSIEKVVDSTNDKGEVDISKLQKPWEELSPKAENYDWVQTKSGEWFKGKIIGFYNDRLDFDSEEIDDYTFKLKNITQIKSHTIMSVNVENVASFSGILRYKNKKVKIIQGEHEYEFDIDDVVSFAPDGNREIDLWSGKITLSIDARRGNTNQLDYATDGKVIRRTSDTVLEFKYLGRFSTREGTNTVNNQRINEKYDIYQTRYFFLTPLATEYYTDEFKNIKHQVTLSAGIGYTFFKRGDDEWKISAGPSVIYTQFQSVTTSGDKKHSTLAFEMSTDLKYEISKITDLNFDYKLTFSDKVTGQYKHHMVTKLENELTSWLDFDVSLVWDYLHAPQQKDDGTIPKKDDLQLLVGVGIEF